LNSLFDYGLGARKTSKTLMNDTSSRSHLVFSIIIEAVNTQTGQVRKIINFFNETRKLVENYHLSILQDQKG